MLLGKLSLLKNYVLATEKDGEIVNILRHFPLELALQPLLYIAFSVLFTLKFSKNLSSVGSVFAL